MSYRYNPYRDMFEHIQDEQPITAYGTGTAHDYSAIPVYAFPVVYLDEGCIDRIADAVVRKLRGLQDETDKR